MLLFTVQSSYWCNLRAMTSLPWVYKPVRGRGWALAWTGLEGRAKKAYLPPERAPVLLLGAPPESHDSGEETGAEDALSVGREA